MSEVSFVPTSEDHVKHVGENARETERIEIYELSRTTVLKRLERSVKLSDRTATILIDGTPVAIFGVGKATSLSDTGVPWMITTDEAAKHAKTILPYGPIMLERMKQGSKKLVNLVHVDNKKSIRWLKALGFTFGEPQKLGWRGAEYMYFELEG